ncbi:MAG TPA: glycosyltransferase family 2 protein [Methylophilus sp.]|nr:glycosyltransferase family 2 protein [Methylophilus sp.]HQQ34007.1 glycosyltransferase family 2 protein [Methylophilus sp.]
MLISVILVSYNTAQMSIDALHHLYASKGNFELEVIVIDNASRDNSVDLIRLAFPQVKLLVNTNNVGFGRANNQAIPLINGDYVLLLNTDAFIKTDTIDKTVAYMNLHPRAGVLGVRLVGRDGELQPSCRYFPTVMNLFLQRAGLSRFFPNVKYVDDMDWDHATARACDWVPGCYYLIRREVIEQVGLFDERYFLYNEEVDHCKATKNAGWDVVFYPDAEVIHIGGESAKSDGIISQVSRQLVALQVESEFLYFRKNHGIIVVLQHLFMQMIADIILIIKAISRVRPLQVLRQHLQHLVLLTKSAYATRLGHQGTK